jgi:hypothetical protein
MTERHEHAVDTGTPRRLRAQGVEQEDGRLPTPGELVAERLRILEAFVADHGLGYCDGQYEGSR